MRLMLFMARLMEPKRIKASKPAIRIWIVRAKVSLTVNKTRFCLIQILDM